MSSSSKARKRGCPSQRKAKDTNVRTLHDFFHFRSSQNDDSSSSRKSSSCQRQSSIQSFFSISSTVNAVNGDACPSTPPSPPATPMTPETPPTPQDTNSLGTPSTLTMVQHGTPPTPDDMAKDSVKRNTNCFNSQVAQVSKLSVISESSDFVNGVGRFGTPESAPPGGPTEGHRAFFTKKPDFGTPDDSTIPPSPSSHKRTTLSPSINKRVGTFESTKNTQRDKQKAPVTSGTLQSTIRDTSTPTATHSVVPSKEETRPLLPLVTQVDVSKVKCVGKTFATPQSTPPKVVENTKETKKTVCTTQSSPNDLRNKPDPSSQRNRKRKPLQQMYLDFGQQNFAKRSICPICGMLYVHGLAEDSKQHARVCANHVKGVPFQSPKARVVATFGPKGSIVEVRPTDSYAIRNKLSQVKAIVDQELGFAKSDEPVKRTAFLYIVDKRVVGMVAAEIISRAYFLESNLERSRESTKAMLGIHQMWVHNKYRKQSIATRLVDTVRSKMVYGHVVPPELLAFSSPTEAGANFARRYLESFTKVDKPLRVLVYVCH